MLLIKLSGKHRAGKTGVFVLWINWDCLYPRVWGAVTDACWLLFVLSLLYLFSTLLRPGRLTSADRREGRGWGGFFFSSSHSLLREPRPWPVPCLPCKVPERNTPGDIPSSPLRCCWPCLREERHASDAVVLRGGGERPVQVLHHGQDDSVLPHGHAPRKRRPPVVAGALLFLSTRGF